MVSVIDFSSAGFSTVAVGSEREGQRSGGASPEIERAKHRPIVRSETEEHAERFDGEQRAEDLWRRAAAVLAQSHVNEAWRTRVAAREIHARHRVRRATCPENGCRGRTKFTRRTDGHEEIGRVDGVPEDPTVGISRLELENAFHQPAGYVLERQYPDTGSSEVARTHQSGVGAAAEAHRRSKEPLLPATPISARTICRE